MTILLGCLPFLSISAWFFPKNHRDQICIEKDADKDWRERGGVLAITSQVHNQPQLLLKCC